ncbi:hypothetical protein PINS_up020868 [Pythium insidiosum]|nr:hypothetical protein PINS_up020868 [Pythium insidiosum]
MVFQVASGANAAAVEAIFKEHAVPISKIGRVHNKNGDIKIAVNGKVVVSDQVADLRDVWEATSFELEKKQCNPECVAQEQHSLRTRTGPRGR